MKHSILKASIAALTLFIMFGCSTKKTEQAQTETPVEPQSVVTLTIGDKDTTFTDAVIFYDSTNNSTHVKGGAMSDSYYFIFDFPGKQPGSFENGSLTLMEYSPATVSGTLNHFGQDSITGTFNGSVQKLDKKGLPIKKDIPISGKFKK